MESVILGIVGALLSLAFSYIPAFRVWLEGQTSRGLIMLGFVALVTAAYFGLSCSPFAADLGISLSCDKAGAIELLKALFVIASGNQLAYLFAHGKSG